MVGTNNDWGWFKHYRKMMTLFWHNYFASAYSKVFYPQAMYQQIISLEKIVWAILKIYLDK